MIPYGRHCLDQADINAVIEVLKSDWLTCGPVVDGFESAFAQTVGAQHAVSCSNGTTALHLALLALGVGQGDVVLVPAVTFLASANAARYVGADVVFVDVDPKTGLMTAETLKEATFQHREKNLKAVINVHLAGQCEDLESIHDVAREHGLWIIEDAAHAIGTEYLSKNDTRHAIGSNHYSDLTTFSFHPVKTIAMGEGGAVTTQDANIAQKLKILRSHGMIKEPSQWRKQNEETGPWYYEMHELGYNYRISDIHCALGLSQLRKLQQFKDDRALRVRHYDALFSKMKDITLLCRTQCSDTAWHLYVVCVDFKRWGVSRKAFMEALKLQGIGTQVHYIPLYKHPYYQKLYGETVLRGAEAYYSTCLSLPLYVGLTSEVQETIVDFFQTYAQ
jgi:UDP-4-amino-4,6-dideoxy-N-acetyl-beta-L-altrosamine transaminase